MLLVVPVVLVLLPVPVVLLPEPPAPLVAPVVAPFDELESSSPPSPPSFGAPEEELHADVCSAAIEITANESKNLSFMVPQRAIGTARE